MTACPACSPRTTIGALADGPAACAAKPGEDATTRPDWSLIWTSAPVCVARSSTGLRSALAQLSVRSHAAAAATTTALVRSECCRATRADTSAEANTAVSPASSATAASATEMKASASRRPSALPRAAGPGGAPASVIAGQAQPVSAAQDGLHDPGSTRILLDLAAQV